MLMVAFATRRADIAAAVVLPRLVVGLLEVRSEVSGSASPSIVIVRESTLGEASLLDRLDSARLRACGGEAVFPPWALVDA